MSRRKGEKEEEIPTFVPASSSSASSSDPQNQIPSTTSPTTSISSIQDGSSIPLRSRQNGVGNLQGNDPAPEGNVDGPSSLSLNESNPLVQAAEGNTAEGQTDPAAANVIEEVRDLGEEMRFYAKQVYLLIIPIFATFALTVWWARTIFLEINISSENVLLVYQEQESDSTGLKIGGAILNALIILGCILVVTVIFVCLFYYNCMKIIFGWLITSTVLILGGIGGLIAYYLMYAYNDSLDWLTFAFILWNFAVVGIASIFWKAPLFVQQGYLVIISALVATNLLQLPEWTAFALVAVVAIYDLFAVLCPRGPLKILVNTAQERNQTIPALLYSAGMADVGKASSKVGAYTAISTSDPESDGEPRQQGQTSRSAEIEGAYQRENQNPEEQPNQAPKKKSKFRRRQNENPEEDDEPTGVQLGLGDFVFYSVLVGRAALTDWITIVSCSIACITGLGLTLILLGIFQKALPALPISIALGIIFYFLTSLVLTPLSDVLATHQVFV